MSDEIIKILDDLGQRFGVAIDWSSENIMPYLKDLMRRYINYEIITSIVWLIVFVIGSIGMIIAVQKLIKHQHKYNKSCSYECEKIIWPTIICISFMFLILFCIIGIGCQINDLIMCNTIPEQLIINYISNLAIEY